MRVADSNDRSGARWLVIYFAVVLAVLVVSCCLTVANAQTVPGALTIRWTLPTTGCLNATDPPICNQPLTGNAALTAVRVWISTSPIPDAPTGNPTLTLAAGVTTATHTMQVTNGQTLYVRVGARNASLESGLSAQMTKVIALDVRPGVPTNVTIELVIGGP